MCLTTHFSRANTCMKCSGIDDMTDLSRVSLPPYDNRLAFQPAILLCTASINDWYWPLLGWLVVSGRPRYFAGSVEGPHCRISATTDTRFGAIEIGTKELFAEFTFSPVSLSYSFRIRIITFRVVACASAMMIVSSANRISCREIRIGGCMTPMELFMKVVTVSATIIKIIGDKGQPCRKPRLCKKNGVTDPLTNTVDEEVWSELSTADVHFGGKPRSMRTLTRKHQSTESNAFSKSTLNKTASIEVAI